MAQINSLIDTPTFDDGQGAGEAPTVPGMLKPTVTGQTKIMGSTSATTVSLVTPVKLPPIRLY